MKKEGLSRFMKIGKETFELYEIKNTKKDAKQLAERLRGSKNETKVRVVNDVAGYLVYRA